MKGRIYIIVLCMIMLTSNIIFAEEVSSVISPKELEIPLYLALEVEDDTFIISWKNPNKVFTMRNINYQIDFKVGRGEWISINKGLPSNHLTFTPDGKTSVIFDPIEEGINTESIDLEKNSYSFRVRYVYSNNEGGIISNVNGLFSSPVTLGLQPYYQNASKWAFEELDKAVEYGMIPDSIRDDMKEEITREEFSEVIVKLYELKTGMTINYEGQEFKDTNNPEVLKAAKLGIVKGVGKGKFSPKSLVTRQEIAVMLKRTLAVIYPENDFIYQGDLGGIVESNIAQWAIDDVNFMRSIEILKGDNKGLIDPVGHTTREQAVVLTLRTYDRFK